MNYWSIAAILIGGLSALIGIWSAEDLVKWKASVASAVTAAGLIVGVVLVLLQHLDATSATEQERHRHTEIVSQLKAQFDDAQKREAVIRDQFRALQAATILHTLEVKWTFRDAPKELTSAIALAEAMAHTYSMSDDEFSRMPGDAIEAVMNSWHIEHAVVPILAALADSSMDAMRFFKGEDVEEAIAFVKGDLDIDPYDAWFDLSYKGPKDPVLLLPLNTTRNGTIALGRKIDDLRPYTLRENPDNYDALYNLVAKANSYGFSARANILDNGFELNFVYDSESLDNAVRLDKGQNRTIGLPDEFQLIIVANGLPDGFDYVGRFAKEFEPFGSNDNEESTLTIVANGVEAAAQRFRVGRKGTSEYRIDWGAYDEPELLFSYTTFHATRIEK